MEDRRVSIVIPAFGRARQLSYAIASLVDEQHLIHEIIVVDDASPEKLAPAIPAVFAGRLKVLRLDVNAGSSVARQAAVDLATAPLLGFLDSDDAWLPGKLAAQLAMLPANADMVAVATGWQEVDAGGRLGRCRIPIASSRPQDFAAGCWFCPGSTVVISRAAFMRCGPFDPQLRRLEDLDWFLRFALLGGRLIVVPIVGALIRHSTSRDRRAVETAADHISAKFRTTFASEQRVLRTLEAWLDVERALAARANGLSVAAAGYLARSFFRKPRTSAQLQKWWQPAVSGLSQKQVEDRFGIGF